MGQFMHEFSRNENIYETAHGADVLNFYWNAIFRLCFAYLIFPTAMIGLTGMEIQTATAKADVWAIYSGIQIGFGLFLLLCSRKSALYQAALLSIVFILGGVAVGRTLGILIYDAYDTYSFSALAFEWTGSIVALWLSARLNKHASINHQ